MSNTLKFGNGEWYGKEGTILAYNDENNNYKPLPFTFERDSVATRVNKQGLIETVGADQPRIDYLNDSNGALLLEPSRTNLIPYSEDFSQPTWNKTGLTVSSNQILSPSGSLDADEVNITTANAHYLFDTISVSESTNYTFTFYVKKGTATDVSYSILNATNFTNIVNTTSYFNEISDTDWTRISVEFTTPSGCTSIRTYPLRDGSSTGTVYLWGAQLESGSYATSYIPTQGGSAVTRLADVCSQTVPDGVINSSEGVLYGEVIFSDNELNNKSITLHNGTTAERVIFSSSPNSLNQVRCQVVSGSISRGEIFVIVDDITSINKFAVMFENSLLTLYINGIKYTTPLTQLPSNLNSIQNGNFNNTSTFYGNIKDLRVYNTALSDQELAALTQV